MTSVLTDHERTEMRPSRFPKYPVPKGQGAGD